MSFNWHSDLITRDTPVTSDYLTTQNVRRFLVAETGKPVSLPRAFMVWIRSGQPQTMGDVADELSRRIADQSATAI